MNSDEVYTDELPEGMVLEMDGYLVIGTKKENIEKGKESA